VVVRNRLAGVGRPAGDHDVADRLTEVAAVAGEELREVAVALLEGRHGAEARTRVDLLALRLEADEEERLVALLVEAGQEDRTADVEAGVLILALRLGRSGDRVR